MQILYASLKTLLGTYFPHILKYDSVNHNKANYWLTVKWVKQIFWFPSAYKSYAYTILWSTKYARAHLLKYTYLILKSFIAKK